MKFSTRVFYKITSVIALVFCVQMVSFAIAPSAPTVSGSLTICSGDSANLTASINPPEANVVFRWFREIAPSTFIQDFEGNPYRPGPMLATTNYYVAAYDTVLMQSSTPTYFTLTVVAANTDIVSASSNDVTVCNGATTVFTATSQLSLTDFFWYDSLASSAPLFNGNPFTSPPLTISRNFFVASADVNGCKSPRVLVASPVVLSAVTPPSPDPLFTTICSGQSSTFTATGSGADTLFYWYDAINATTPIDSGSSFTTPTINNPGVTNATYTYYVEAGNVNGCRSARLSVQQVVTPAVDFPSVDPVTSNVCSGQSATFTASSNVVSGQFYWFDSISAGNLLFSGNPYTTPAQNNNGATPLSNEYYVEVRDTNGCASLRQQATVITQPFVDVPTIDPAATTVCSGDSVTFTASSTLGNGQFVWYDTITAGSAIFNGNPYTRTFTNTSAAVNTFNIYVSSRDTAGCESSRASSTVTIQPALDFPIVNPVADTVCSGGVASFTATSNLGTVSEVRWYDAATGGNLLFTGTTYDFNAPSNTTASNQVYTFYAELVDSAGCKSLRAEATAVVTPGLESPTVTPPFQNVCNGTGTQFVASSTIGSGVEFYWYDSITGGNNLFVGATFNTGPIFSTGPGDVSREYYVEMRDLNGCTSIRSQGQAFITNATDEPTVDPATATICNGDSVLFTAGSVLGSAIEFYWYDSVASGNLLATGIEFNTGALFSNGPGDPGRTYYLELQDTTGCRSNRTAAQVVFNTGVDAPTVDPPTETICSGDSVIFVASSTLGSGSIFTWYDSIASGNQIFVGDTFNTGAIIAQNVSDNSRRYYVSVKDGSGCESSRTLASVIITTSNTVILVDQPSQIICNGSSATFVASSSTGGTYTFNWYDDANGGNLLFSGDTFVTTPYISNGGTDDFRTYYVEGVDSVGCRSLRSSASTTNAPLLDAPSVNPPIQTVCNGARATMVASSNLGSGIRFKWYDAPQAGNLLFEGDTFISPPINNPSTSDLNYAFYAEAVDSTGCQSERVPGIVTVNPALEAPLVNPPADTICNGASTQFVASTNIGSGYTFNWYDSIAGGTLLFTGDTFQTGPLNNNSSSQVSYSYYVEAVDSAGCTSLRNTATVIIRPAADVVIADSTTKIVCNGSSAQFVASSAVNPNATFNWYDSIAGGNLLFTGQVFNTQPLFNNGNQLETYRFYVESVDSAGCTSERSTVTAVVRQQIDAPLVDPPAATICSGARGTFIASSLIDNNDIFNWYDSAASGTLIFTGDTFVTDILTNTGTTNAQQNFSVEALDSAGCASNRVPVAVTILPASQPAVANPPAPVCSGNSAVLSVNKIADPNATIYWYDTLDSAVPLFIGDTFVTEPLYNSGTSNATVDYYYESVDSNGCISARLPVQVVVYPGGTPPNVTPTDTTICSNQSAVFVAGSLTGAQNNTYYWYDSITDGRLLFVGDTFNTGPLSNSASTAATYRFYVESRDSSQCTSTRNMATVVINPALTVPTVSPQAQNICSGDSAQFVASTPLQEDYNFHWYDAANNGNLLFVGDTFNTGKVNSTSSSDINKMYYVEATDQNGCASPRSTATLIVSSNNDAVLLVPASSTICQGDTTTITAVSTNGNTEIRWYNSATDTTPIFTGNVYNTGILTTSTTYYVASVSNANGCESKRFAITIKVNTANPLQAPTLNCERIDNNTIEFTWNTVVDANGYEVSNDGGSSWKIPSSGTFATTHRETKKSADQLTATLVVRAVNSANTCAPGNGSVSDPLTCTFFEGLTDKFVPNSSFSPNGDGVNDIWIIENGIEFYPRNTVTVLNRWGKEVFSVKGYNNSTVAFDGEGLEDGAYFYVITIPEIGVQKTGYLMIIR